VCLSGIKLCHSAGICLALDGTRYALGRVERDRSRISRPSILLLGATSCCGHTEFSMSSYSSGITSSFDPALIHSEIALLQDAPAELSFSDDFDALQQCIAEDRTRKNKDGIVIQHRAWNLVDIFRSEGEHLTGKPSA
jgi:hypothetical protein